VSRLPTEAATTNAKNMGTTMTSFVLQFDPSVIDSLEDEYLLKEGHKDQLMEAAGHQLITGNYSLNNLEIIGNWKSPRAVHHLQRNDIAAIESALRTACHSGSERTAMNALLGLYGVQVRMASAILTAINQIRYTVIDFRALEALGAVNNAPSVDYYLEYLDACRRISQQVNRKMRTLDRAMWQWSKKRGQTGGACA
jgi:hypothetical protein